MDDWTHQAKKQPPKKGETISTDYACYEPIVASIRTSLWMIGPTKPKNSPPKKGKRLPLFTLATIATTTQREIPRSMPDTVNRGKTVPKTFCPVYARSCGVVHVAFPSIFFRVHLPYVPADGPGKEGPAGTKEGEKRGGGSGNSC